MNIAIESKGTELFVKIEGRMDTNTSPKLEVELRNHINGVETLIIDMEKLDYISSAGLRVLLTAQKVMNKQGEMIIRNANDDVMDIFEVTGFVDIFTIE